MVGAGVLGSLAGCLGAAGAPVAPGGSSGDPGGGQSVAGRDLPISESALTRATRPDAIPAITAPAFDTDWRGVGRDVDPLRPDDAVVGVEREGRARAYPLRVLGWHEIVNDDFGGPLLVTFCPLCGSGIAAERTVNGEATVFGVSGLLLESNLVMYDRRTESLWSQIAMTAIRGPETGSALSMSPSRLTTWGTWQASHPETTVLLPPPASETIDGSVDGNYDRIPFGAYQPGATTESGGPEASAAPTVLGITANGSATAYPRGEVQAAGVVNDAVGGLPVVVAVAADGLTMVAYVRSVDGRTPEFDRVSETHLGADGSRWELTSGRAVDGPHAGAVLEPAAARPQMLRSAWRDFQPDSEFYLAGD
jgi:hypothetical protein